MRIVLLICSFATLLFSIQPSTAKGPFGSISIAGWTGGAFMSSRDEFTGCTVSSPHQSDFTAYVSVFSDMAWNIGFSNDSWRLKKGEQFSVTLIFDRKASLKAKGLALSAHSVSVEMPNNPSLIEQFQEAATLSVLIEQQQFHLRLTGASQLLPSLIRCVKTISQASRTAFGVTGNTFSSRRGRASSVFRALGVRGMRRGYPFLVVRTSTVLLTKSTSRHRIERSSPRRIPVSTNRIRNGRRYQEDRL